MKYAKDTVLPAHVSTLTDLQQHKWREVFNWASYEGKSDTKALAIANGVVKRGFKEGVSADVLASFADTEALPAEIALGEKSYQYVDSWEYESRKVSQSDAGYNAVGMTGTRGCSNCIFFVSPARCTLVNGEIAPNGLSSLWKAVPVYDPFANPIPVIIVEGGSFKETKDTRSVAQRVLSAAAETLGMKARSAPPASTGLKIFRQKDGSLRWVARYSNSWEDKDKELIPQAAHIEYQEWATKEQLYPELWLWHTPGTRFGQTDMLDFVDGFAFASGTIDNTKEALAVVDFLATQDVAVSHGFVCSQKGKYIDKYRSYELSILPAVRASALETDFNIFGKETDVMKFNPVQRAFLVGGITEGEVAKIEASSEKSAAALKQLGIEFKQVEEPAVDADPAAANQTLEAVKALGGVVATMTEHLGQLVTLVGATKQTADKALQVAEKSREEVVSDEFLARAAKSIGGAATRPSESDGNVTDPTKVKALGLPGGETAFDFGDLITKQIGMSLKLEGGAAAAEVGLMPTSVS